MTDLPNGHPICPKCGKPANVTSTSFGWRYDHCGLHSWDGKPLVSPAVHAARQRFCAAFDRLWKTAETAYEITESPATDAYRNAVKRIRIAARNRAYRYLAAMTGLPEPECHGATQDDLDKLDRLTTIAAACVGPEEVRYWQKNKDDDDGNGKEDRAEGGPIAGPQNEPF